MATQRVDSTVDTGTGEVLVHCAYDKMIPVERLIPNPRNPNRHPERQIDVLAKMIVAQGWRCPITVSNQSGFIVRGHGRLQAALRAGLSVAPVDYQDYENEAAEWADLIADNRIAELAETDFTALADLLVSLDTGAFDLDLTGFSEGELKNIMGWTPGGEVAAPDSFKEYGEDIETEYCCPKCGYEWSGKPKNEQA